MTDPDTEPATETETKTETRTEIQTETETKTARGTNTETETVPATGTETHRDRKREKGCRKDSVSKRERETAKAGKHKTRRLSRPSVAVASTRAVSPLPWKDAAGTPEVPAPVLHREGLVFRRPLTDRGSSRRYLAAAARRAWLCPLYTCNCFPPRFCRRCTGIFFLGGVTV